MKKKLKNKWYVFKENNPSTHIFLLIILVNIAFILLSSVMLLFLPENQDRTFPEIVRFAFTLMINPSGRYVYSDYPISLFITTLVVLLGMISLTGGTVGYITSVISGFLEKSANSRSRTKLNNHIVILNYNKKVPAIIYDYCFDDVENTYITILSHKDKDEVKNEIDMMYNQNHVKKKFKNIIVRDGNPMSKLDLDNINLKDAQTVLIMEPEYEEEKGKASLDSQSFQVSKLFMFITWYFSQLPTKSKANIVVESNSPNMEQMVQGYHMEKNKQISVPVNYNEIVGKLLAVTAIMPSINDVMQQLFSFEGVEIYIEDKPNTDLLTELKTKRSVLPLFDQGKKRVYVAENEEELYRKSAKEFVLQKALPQEKFIPRIVFEKSEILMIGVNHKLSYILESLSCFRKEYGNHKLHVTLADTAEGEEVLKSYYENPRYEEILQSKSCSPIIIKDIFHLADELGDLINTKTDSILLLSDDQVSGPHLDEKPLLFWNSLKRVVEKRDDLDVVVEILDSQNKDIIEKKNKDQVIVSDDFLGHLYAQLGKNPLRYDVMKDIITSEGDPTSRNIDQEMQNEGDLLCVNVATFFQNLPCNLTFASKRELVLWVYEATNQTYLPIGCMKNHTTYLFSRTDQEQDGLDSVVLSAKEEGQVYSTAQNNITLEKEDELIVIKLG